MVLAFLPGVFPWVGVPPGVGGVGGVLKEEAGGLRPFPALVTNRERFFSVLWFPLRHMEVLSWPQGSEGGREHLSRPSAEVKNLA